MLINIHLNRQQEEGIEITSEYDDDECIAFNTDQICAVRYRQTGGKHHFMVLTAAGTINLYISGEIDAVQSFVSHLMDICNVRQM